MNDLSHLTGLTTAFGKDLAMERDLLALNDLLAPIEMMLRSQAEVAPQRALVFVLGPPRSGSTLTSQLLSSCGAFAAISNFTAKFWKAPALGLRLERALRIDRSQDFQSVRGRTSGASAPHEFGYFWSSWFDLGQETHSLSATLLDRVDITGLRRALAAMEAEVSLPLAFKNNTWFTFQAGWLARMFPTSVFVACRRDPFFVAQSLYQQRLAVHGDPAHWWSVRPASYPQLSTLPPFEQVAAQAVEIEREMDEALAAIPESRLIQANYERLCSQPHQLLEEISTACAMFGPKPVLHLEQVPRRFQQADHVRLPEATARSLRRLVEERRSRT